MATHAEKSVNSRLAISPEYRRVTDGGTDGQTEILRWHSRRYA